jgi:hypothetical protein
MNILRSFAVLFILVLTAGIFVGCTSPKTTTMVSQTIAPVSVSTTPVQTVQVSATQTTIPVTNDASARRVASNTFATLTIPTTTPLAMIYSVTEMGSCAGGGSWFSQYIFDEDTGDSSYCIEGCDGSWYQSWLVGPPHGGAVVTYAPSDSGNMTIDLALNRMHDAQNSVAVNTDISTSAKQKLLNDAFQNSVSLLSQGGEKGEFLNIINTTVANDAIINDSPKSGEKVVFNHAQNNEPAVIVTSCRCYDQYTTSTGSRAVPINFNSGTTNARLLSPTQIPETIETEKPHPETVYTWLYRIHTCICSGGVSQTWYLVGV